MKQTRLFQNAFLIYSSAMSARQGVGHCKNVSLLASWGISIPSKLVQGVLDKPWPAQNQYIFVNACKLVSSVHCLYQWIKPVDL